jgi:hypothetical protein
MNHEEMRELVAAFAFDALEPDEERAVLEHLETCEECGQLLAETHEVAADLAGDVPVDLTAIVAEEMAGSDLRARIVAAAEAEPRATAGPPAAQPPSPRTGAVSAPVDRRGPGRRSRRALVRSRVLVGAVGAALAVAVAVPVTLATSGGSGGNNGQTALADALLQPGAREVTLGGSSGTAARAVVSSKGVVFIADGLTPNDTGDQTYVLWAGNGTGVRPLATFDARSGKTTQVAALSLPYQAADVALVAVSLEPGRTAPTTPTKIVLSGKPA